MAVTGIANGSTSSPTRSLLQVVVAGRNLQIFVATQATYNMMLGQGAGTAGTLARFAGCAVHQLS